MMSQDEPRHQDGPEVACQRGLFFSGKFIIPFFPGLVRIS